MNKKVKRRILSLALATLLVAPSMAGCAGGSTDSESLRFWGYGDATVKDAFNAMVDAYNNGQGKLDGVNVRYTHKPEQGYVDLIEQSSTSKSGADVFMTWDRFFKKWANQGMLTNLQAYADASEADGSLDVDSIWDSTVSRFRYNPELNISDDNEDLYGLPVDTSPTALFYNRDAMNQVGVIVISVAAEQMDEWNAGTIADKYGKKKSDIPALANVNVPAKGYFRNDNNLYREGTTWQKPADGTVLVFNDQIPMNWDESEDLAHLMTKKYNTATTTDYGYYTEWWFNYGWSVGGDCIVDMSGNGSWAYSHADSSANYIVSEGKTYTGAITGKTYVAGETLEFLDKMDCAVGDIIESDDVGGYKKNSTTLRKVDDEATVGIRSSVLEATTSGTLTELPSVREAFIRFCSLSGVEGKALNICAPTSALTTTSSINYFTGGKVGMIVERALNIPVVNEYVGDKFEWASAPLPEYKEYKDPTDPQCDETVKRGKIAGHSESTALTIRERSEKKDLAWKFIRWMVSAEAQAIKASYGFIPNQKTAVDAFYQKLDKDNVRNLENFVSAIEFETPGDWWYMVNKDWIDAWANPLNQQVRKGELDVSDFLDMYTVYGNEEVQRYGNYEGELGKVKDYQN
ncbi:MAG: extracellular solute-binding protein [Clostridia bacterium]|nr:extracellular solute-binding protein [Clostridia bacterium]